MTPKDPLEEIEIAASDDDELKHQLYKLNGKFQHLLQ